MLIHIARIICVLKRVQMHKGKWLVFGAGLKLRWQLNPALVGNWHFSYITATTKCQFVCSTHHHAAESTNIS